IAWLRVGYQNRGIPRAAAADCRALGRRAQVSELERSETGGGDPDGFAGGAGGTPVGSSARRAMRPSPRVADVDREARVRRWICWRSRPSARDRADVAAVRRER